MADNYLITGYWGEPHVTAENDRGIHGGIFGAGRFVLPVGKQFNAEYIGNNTVRMYDGKLMDNGAAGGIPTGEYVDLLIANAGQGMVRNDLIVFQYSKDTSTSVETGSFIIIQGTEVSSNATDPQLIQADLLGGDVNIDQMPLWRVVVSGTSIAAPVKMFTLSNNLGETVKDGDLADWAKASTKPGYNAKEISGLADLIYPVGSIYMSTNSVDPSTLFGGTWQQIKDTFLLSAGDSYEAGTTGGEAEHTLTEDELPVHNHYAYKYTGVDDDWGILNIKRDNKARTQVATSSSSGKYAVTSTVSGNLDWPYCTRSDVGGRTTDDNIAHNNMPPYLAVYVWKRTA